MIDKILTQEQLQEIAKKIWNESQDQIVKSVTYGIQEELRIHAKTLTRKYLDAQIGEIVKGIVKSKEIEIRATLERLSTRVIEHATTRFESEMGYLVQQRMSDAVTGPLESLGKDLSRLMFKVVEGVLNASKGAREIEAMKKKTET
jgi:hypothetical protein